MDLTYPALVTGKNCDIFTREIPPHLKQCFLCKQILENLKSASWIYSWNDMIMSLFVGLGHPETFSTWFLRNQGAGSETRWLEAAKWLRALDDVGTPGAGWTSSGKLPGRFMVRWWKHGIIKTCVLPSKINGSGIWHSYFFFGMKSIQNVSQFFSFETYTREIILWNLKVTPLKGNSSSIHLHDLGVQGVNFRESI